MLYMSALTVIGKTNWRNTNQVFGIKDTDRLNHIYAIGKTGTGKSTLLLNMAISDIEAGNGVGIIDPHGELSEKILNYIPLHRIRDVIYFNACDTEYPIAFNPLDEAANKDHAVIASSIINAFKNLWPDSWGPRLEHILRFCLLTLLLSKDATLLDIQPLLTNKSFRSKILSSCTNNTINAFWVNEFDKYSPTFRNEAIAPIINKIGLLSASQVIRRIVGQKKEISIQKIIDSKQILICNLSKGQIGEDACALLGSVIVTSLQAAALYRAKYPDRIFNNFYLYVDEMQTFVTLSFAKMLSECRKYGLSLFLTHQYIDQLSPELQEAIFGNIGTLICFRVGTPDAEVLSREFYPVFTMDDIINLPKYSMYLRLCIDGTVSKPFSASSLPPKPIVISHKANIIGMSQIAFGRLRTTIEKEIQTRNEATPKINPVFLTENW